MIADAPAFVLPSALVVGGAVGLVWGGDRLVEHASSLGRAARLSPAVVGTLVLGFGTSLPELGVSALAMLSGSPEIALGNVVGSNIANVGLIIGLAGLLAPFAVAPRFLRLELPATVAAGPALLLAAAFCGGVTLVPALVLLGAFACYVTRVLRTAPTEAPADAPPRPWRALALDGLWLTVALAAVCGGAQAFVNGATGVANLLRVPSAVIGLTLVAVGTSLPELATTVAAARRGEAELAFGNVLGSNVFNATFILGAIGVAAPLPIHGRALAVDIPVMTAFAVLAAPWRRSGLGRLQGLVLLAGYAAYVSVLFHSLAPD